MKASDKKLIFRLLHNQVKLFTPSPTSSLFIPIVTDQFSEAIQSYKK